MGRSRASWPCSHRSPSMSSRWARTASLPASGPPTMPACGSTEGSSSSGTKSSTTCATATSSWSSRSGASSRRGSSWGTGTTGSGQPWTRSRTRRRSTRCTQPATCRGRCGRTTVIAAQFRSRQDNPVPEAAVLSFAFDRPDGGTPLKVLCLGAHSDDIEIGCGGTVLRLGRENPNTCFTWVVFSSDQERAAEARRSADSFLACVPDRTVLVEGFRDGYFPYIGTQVKDCFEQLKRLSPDVIFTHYREDRHQDHRLVSDLTWNTFRDHLILEYEIPKYDGDLGSPNLFVHLDEPTIHGKIDRIVEHFLTQDNRHWFTRETFLSLLRLRGIESRSPGGYAEGFHCRKVTM